MLLIRVTNLLIFLFTTVCFILNFHKDGEWKAANGLYALRYFTILSNLLSALAALLVALNVSEQGLPFGIWLLKYVATAAVTVTFLTVMVFLGPTMGYKSQLEHAGFYYHAAGPLMAVLSFCFMERFHGVLSCRLRACCRSSCTGCCIHGRCSSVRRSAAGKTFTVSPKAAAGSCRPARCCSAPS